VEVKGKLDRAINEFLDPVRERRAYYKARPGLIEEILISGNRRMRQESEETMRLVRDAMGLMKLEARSNSAGNGTVPPGLVFC
jgi:tryptophanyl-tRNA synthetase